MTATAEQMENRKAWLADLRSGQYRQGRGYLEVVLEDGVSSFCCLGIACRLVGLPKIESIERGYEGVQFYGSPDENSMNVLPTSAQVKFGFTTESPHAIFNGLSRSLWELNDDVRLSFEEIADVLEPHLLDPEYDGNLALE